MSAIVRCNRYFWIFLYVLRLTSAAPSREAQLRLFCKAMEIFPESRPVEKWTGVGLATGSDVLMTGHIGQRIPPAQGVGERRQHFVLKVGEGLEVGSLELDADGKVVAALSSMEAGHAGMPGPVIGRDELDQSTVALDDEMGRHPQGA